MKIPFEEPKNALFASFRDAMEKIEMAGSGEDGFELADLFTLDHLEALDELGDFSSRDATTIAKTFEKMSLQAMRAFNCATIADMSAIPNSLREVEFNGIGLPDSVPWLQEGGAVLQAYVSDIQGLATAIQNAQSNGEWDKVIVQAAELTNMAVNTVMDLTDKVTARAGLIVNIIYAVAMGVYRLVTFLQKNKAAAETKQSDIGPIEYRLPLIQQGSSGDEHPDSRLYKDVLLKYATRTKSNDFDFGDWTNIFSPVCTDPLADELTAHPSVFLGSFNPPDFTNKTAYYSMFCMGDRLADGRSPNYNWVGDNDPNPKTIPQIPGGPNGIASLLKSQKISWGAVPGAGVFRAACWAYGIPQGKGKAGKNSVIKKVAWQINRKQWNLGEYGTQFGHFEQVRPMCDVVVESMWQQVTSVFNNKPSAAMYLINPRVALTRWSMWYSQWVGFFTEQITSGHYPKWYTARVEGKLVGEGRMSEKEARLWSWRNLLFHAACELLGPGMIRMIPKWGGEINRYFHLMEHMYAESGPRVYEHHLKYSEVETYVPWDNTIEDNPALGGKTISNSLGGKVLVRNLPEKAWLPPRYLDTFSFTKHQFETLERAQMHYIRQPGVIDALVRQMNVERPEELLFVLPAFQDHNDINGPVRKPYGENKVRNTFLNMLAPGYQTDLAPAPGTFNWGDTGGHGPGGRRSTGGGGAGGIIALGLLGAFIAARK